VHGASVKTGTITGTQLSNDVWPVVVHVGSRPTLHIIALRCVALQCFAESNMTPCFEPHERVLYVDASGSLSEATIVRVDTSMWPLSYEIRLPGGFERTTVPDRLRRARASAEVGAPGAFSNSAHLPRTAVALQCAATPSRSTLLFTK
jgi:hypothetical protein